jgi:membrane protein implicated in regulation of membrane protease activity
VAPAIRPFDLAPKFSHSSCASKCSGRARLRILLVTLTSVGYRLAQTDKTLWNGGSGSCLGWCCFWERCLLPGAFTSFFRYRCHHRWHSRRLQRRRPVWFQVIVFSCLSLITFWLFGQVLLQSTHHDTPDEVDTLIGETAVITEEIPSRGIGKAEMRGTSWNAHNIGAHSLARGQRCRVERVEGLTIYVRAEQN